MALCDSETRHRHYGSSARSVTTPQAGTGTSPETSCLGRSLVSLSHSRFGAGCDQVSFALTGLSLAPNKRTMIAVPSSLGFSPLTSTSAGSTRSSGVARRCGAAAGHGHQRLAEAGGESRRLGVAAGAAMRTQHEAEHDRAFLVGAVVGAPVVVHRPRVELLRRLDLLAPDVGIGLRVEQRRGDAADLHQRRVERDPGHAEVGVGHVGPAARR